MVKGLVSIIIPTYKGSENIKRAVDSALSQTYEQVEVYVVDDNGSGSKEQIETENELKCYEEDDRVHYIPHEKNINGSAARNTGIKASKGEYIAFLDDDDEFVSNNIQSHMDRFKQVTDDYAMTYCGMELYAPNKAVQTIMPPVEGDVLFDFLCGKIRIGSSLIVVKRHAVEEIGGFDESFRRHQDWEFIVRILENYKIAKVNSVGVKKYNLGRNNAPNAKNLKKIDFIT
jgi:glycosyltransferase involved in cell wall biosynthesis